MREGRHPKPQQMRTFAVARNRPARRPRRRWVSPAFLAREFEGEPALLEPEKHTGLGWFPLDGLPSPLARSAVEAAEALKSR
jgi:hypothetical protein